jgi:shikimate 5-dehydrogenase
MFKANGDDAMMIPMNIREDDLYFTVANMRSSQLKGAVIGAEYRQDVVEVLDEQSGAVSACGFSDILQVREGKLIGDISVGRAVALALKANGVRSLAMLGSGSLAKAVLLALGGSGVEKVTLYNDRVESCMELMQNVGPVEGVTLDIDRASEEMTVDFSAFDAALNVSTLNGSGALPKLEAAPLMIDFCTHPSLFKTAEPEAYLGYEELLPYLTQSAYDILMK